MTDFIVRFEGAKLSPEATRHLQAAIGAAVESALNSADFQKEPTAGAQAVVIPREWLGRWILDLKALRRDPALLDKPLTVSVGAARPG